MKTPTGTQINHDPHQGPGHYVYTRYLDGTNFVTLRFEACGAGHYQGLGARCGPGVRPEAAPELDRAAMYVSVVVAGLQQRGGDIFELHDCFPNTAQFYWERRIYEELVDVMTVHMMALGHKQGGLSC